MPTMLLNSILQFNNQFGRGSVVCIYNNLRLGFLLRWRICLSRFFLLWTLTLFLYLTILQFVEVWWLVWQKFEVAHEKVVLDPVSALLKHLNPHVSSLSCPDFFTNALFVLHHFLFVMLLNLFLVLSICQSNFLDIVLFVLSNDAQKGQLTVP